MLVVLKEAKISHEKVTTLSDVNFTVDEGEFWDVVAEYDISE